MRRAPSALVASFLFLALFTARSHADAPAYGWIEGSAEVTDGYVLFAPYASTGTFLIDNYGRVAKSWPSSYTPGASVYLLDDGNLLRTGAVSVPPEIAGGGYGGVIELLDSSGKQTWEYVLSDDVAQLHHDIAILPNGNILAIAWELKTRSEAIEAGRAPPSVGDELWSEMIVELEPGATGAEIVWAWHVWDHLVQDFDSSAGNYGEVSDHPELIDINFGPTGRDWLHFNGIAYNADLDQIVLTVHSFSELWIIDHSTTVAEAASHEGGTSGMGGDILYRWGNPQAYRAGDSSSKRLFGPHNAQWIPDGFPGGGNILIFNNGLGRPGSQYSTVDEITPPLIDELLYERDADQAFGPAEPAWSYDPEPSFSAAFVSGAQRLSNGNTLICAGPQGVFIEVNSDGETVWRYRNPVMASGPVAQSPTATSSGLCFRATRIEPDHPGLGKLELEVGDPLELYPHTMGDVNNDGVVGVLDAASFEDLYSGPCAEECQDPLYPNALGRVVDFDSDWDVDCDDWRNFEAAWSVAGAPLPFARCAEFLRGDADGNAIVQAPLDALFLLRWKFLAGASPRCIVAADVDGDGSTVGLHDPVSLIRWAFSDGSVPPAPGPFACGVDESAILSCDAPPECR